jgi:TM2 domain-containing membrane protein YozV
METIKPREDWNNPEPLKQGNKRVISGILAILLGWLGIHKFVLGYTNEGIITLVISLVSCGTITSILGIIEGVIYLTKTDAEFYEIYQTNKRGWF